ncbi:MAG: protein-disulfide reductase DsbD N-terminal domain-containing protein, partial [Burkholderiales bacterium]|nr:protein-disulfide reductase DsbD N-terminal domain-containing protein [Burkholderiales bacterium]
MRLIRLFTLLLIALGASLLARAADFLEPAQAFKLSAEAVGPDLVQVRFDIAEGYYLYRERFKFVAPEGVTLAEAELPQGKVKFDETFQKEVETYRGAMQIRVPVQAAKGPFMLEVTSQGCADAGLCYPPEMQRLQVSLAAFGGDGSARLEQQAE